MSDDSIILVFDHPKGYGVVHTNFSGLPESLNALIKHEIEGFGEEGLLVFKDKDQALARARKMLRDRSRNDDLVEYGMEDRTNPDRKFGQPFTEEDRLRAQKKHEKKQRRMDRRRHG